MDPANVDLGEVMASEPALVVAHVPAGSTAQTFAQQLVEALAAQSPPIPTLVVADRYDAATVRNLLAAGVRECLVRPLDVRRLSFFIEAEVIKHRHAPTAATTPLARAETWTTGAFQSVCRKATRIAQRNTTVLLTGETGVGKNYMARLIHDSSPRANEPFVVLNCGAISEHLAESELFGHKKGAFTGATEDYEGHFAASGNGTLLLDEVDSLSLSLQAKLLRALDDRVYEPVGSVTQRKLCSRLIAATNRPIEQVVAEGGFRKDLFYRLRVVELHLPPLRERMGEFRQLADQFVRAICEQEQIPVPLIADEAWKRLEEHDWPGNLRELHNTLEHAILFMHCGVLQANDLPRLDCARILRPPRSDSAPGESLQSDDAPARNGHSLTDARRFGERRALRQILDECNNNKTRAAQALGISRNGLYKRLRAVGLL
jgi:DNA-binding NtrC family response regulator